MAESAHVTSVQAIAALGTALRLFEDEATRALTTIDEQANRAMQWLEHDAPSYWRQEIRRRYEEVTKTRMALEACRRKATPDYKPSCAEEQDAHRAAQRRLQEAEEKLEAVRRWSQKIRREIDEYRGRIMPLRGTLEGDVPRVVTMLERTVATLESYTGRSRDDRGIAPSDPAPAQPAAGDAAGSTPPA